MRKEEAPGNNAQEVVMFRESESSSGIVKNTVDKKGKRKRGVLPTWTKCRVSSAIVRISVLKDMHKSRKSDARILSTQTAILRIKQNLVDEYCPSGYTHAGKPC